MDENRAWFDRITIGIAVWVTLMPVVLPFPGGSTGGAAISVYVTGLAIIVLAAYAVATGGSRWKEALNLLLALWLILSPWVLGYYGEGFASWIQIIGGLIIAFIELAALLHRAKAGGARGGTAR